jgi:hypothetical protein
MEAKRIPKIYRPKCKNKYGMGKEGKVDNKVRADNVCVCVCVCVCVVYNISNLLTC